MAAAESKLKQRIVGAIVLVALAVIFLPMLFKQEDTAREVVVQVPPMPEAPAVPQVPVAEVAVPEPEADDTWDEPLIPETPAAPQSLPDAPVPAEKPVAEVQPAPVQPDVKAEPQPELQQPTPQAVEPGIDKNNLPVSWSVQLASLTNKDNAQALRDSYRDKQYNAYVRSADGTHRVLIGPLIKQEEAQAMCKRLKSREGQDCFVVRYEP
ncbi:SPOR domain-containing protein [Pseudomonas sp. C27(2019)]|uniref:SPOR domain-containing protein n=1 Tax=Pseudomonas sp. C27(2019) TaxID=2604941 RepID=UPI0012451E74|nr:SPOR domain-containing protein [Pseudomonas sp. C27(2019)]QEY58844.1 SPOR domain-containing protein [Pseudomonas sp. C27(2019)]